MSDDARLWAVSVNNGQRSYIVSALSAGDACVVASDHWRADPEVSAKQRTRGIYAIRTRLAKFGEASQQLVVKLERVPEGYALVKVGDVPPWMEYNRMSLSYDAGNYQPDDDPSRGYRLYRIRDSGRDQ